MGCFYFFCVTLDSPLMVFLTFLQMYNLQSRQLGMRREASVAKVPSNSNLDANCNLIVCQFASWMEPHTSTGCGILCSKYGQFPSHFRQEVAKKGLNCAFSGPCFLLNLLFFQRTRAQIPVYFGAWGQGHLDIVELAKCFLELSDFQAGCRKTVTFFVARLNPTIQDMKTHENNSLYLFFPLGPIICDFELRISALRHKSRYYSCLLILFFLRRFGTYWLGCNDAFRWKNADPFWNWSSLTEVRPLTSQPYQSE